MDEYQERYLEHIKNKLKRKQTKHTYDVDSYIDLFENRKSIRRFNDVKVTDNILEILDYAIDLAPSSCNRKGIYYKEVSPEYAEKILVGGKGWLDKANRVFLLFGAKECYKNPKEIPYMPYLDGGFAGQNIYLMCELHSIGCCFVNPNTEEVFEDYLIGAVAIGNYE